MSLPCCIKLQKDPCFLSGRGIITNSGIEDLQRRINQEIDEAIQIAEKDPFPDPEECLKGVYYEGE